MYKPPDSSIHLSKNFTPNLAAKLQNINRENKEVIIMGDINIDYLKKDDHKVIKDIFAVNGYKQLLRSATRTTSSSATLIDVILTNEPSTITNSETINASLSDHDIIACVRKANNIKYEAETIKCRDFSRYNVDIINNELLNAEWKSVYDSNCPVHALKNLMSILVETLNRHAPFITKRVKGKPSPWLTVEVKRHVNVCNQLKRKAKKSGKQCNWLAYNRKRNFVNNEIKRAK